MTTAVLAGLVCRCTAAERNPLAQSEAEAVAGSVDAVTIPAYQWEQDFICWSGGERPGHGTVALTPVKLEHAVYENAWMPGQMTQRPAPVVQPLPKYPEDLRDAGVKGDVLVAFLVTARGTVEKPKVLMASDSRFAKAAEVAVLRWSFRPGVRHGAAVPCVVVQKIKFEVE